MIYKIGSTVADVKSEFSDVTKKSELQIAMQQDSNTQEKISKPDEQTQKDLITETKFTKGIILDRGLEGAGIRNIISDATARHLLSGCVRT